MTPSLLEKALVAYARHFPIRRGKLRLINAAWPLVGGGPFRSASLRHGGFAMECDLREALQRQFYFFGTYFIEETILSHWGEFARRSQTIFDVGANAGVYSLAAAAANSGARVYAFEPTPEIAERLRKAVSDNDLDGQIQVQEAAVSTASGTAALKRWRGEDNQNGGMNFIVERVEEDSESVLTVSIDDFCRDHGLEHIDLLKLDIQGHEASALAGAKRMISGGAVGVIFLELNWGPDDQLSPAQECVDMLSAAGYLFAAPIAELSWSPAGPWLRSLSDIIATKLDVRSDVKG